MKKILKVVSAMTLCAMLVSVMIIPGVQAAYTGTKFVGDLGTTNLIGHWKLDESSGDAINSGSAGSTYDGTVTGATQGVTGKIDNCYSFNTDDYITVPDGDDDLDFGNGDDFSIYGWIRWESDSVHSYCLTKYDTGVGQGFYMQCSTDGNIYINVMSNGSIIAQFYDPLTLNEWHHVGLVREGSTCTGYVDGESIGTDSTAGGNISNDFDFYIGAWLPWNGKIDDVRIYDAAIDPTATMISHWDMEDGSGQTVSDVVGSNDGVLGTSNRAEICDPTWDSIDYKVGSYSLDFNRNSGELVTVYDNDSLDFGSGVDFSIFCWVKADLDNGAILYKSASSRGYKMSITSDDYLKVDLYIGLSSISATGTSDIVNNAWHHVGLVRHGNTLEAWVDGFCEATNTGASGDLANSGNLLFGLGGALGSYFDGNIDDVIIFSEAVVPAA
jgi:hypothetical protein